MGTFFFRMSAWLAFLCVLLVGQSEAGSKKPTTTTTTTTTTQAPVPWVPPYISPNDNTATIVAKYKDALGACTANKNNKDFLRNVGLAMGEGLFSIIPVVGNMAGATKEMVNFMIPENENCYMDKFRDMVVEIVGQAVDTAHVQTITNDLKSWKRMIANIRDFHDSTTQVWLERTMSDMMGEYDNFLNEYSPKRFSAVPVRDYVNLRVSIYEDLFYYDKVNVNAHKADAVQLIKDAARYIKESTALAAAYRKTTVCEKNGYAVTQNTACGRGYGARSLMVDNSKAEDQAEDRPNGAQSRRSPPAPPKWCKIQVIPSDPATCKGLAFYNVLDAQRKAEEVAQSELKEMMPMDAWQNIRASFCQSLSISECSGSLDQIYIRDTSGQDEYYRQQRARYGDNFWGRHNYY